MEPNDHPNYQDGSSLPTGGFGSVLGVSDGFIATAANPEGTCDDLKVADGSGSCEGMWHSSDGLTWRLLGTANEIAGTRGSLCVGDGCNARSGALLPWQGGALAIDRNGRIDLWTSGGSTELPFAAQPNGTTATGPLGIVSIGDGQAVVSRDGIDHNVSSIPAQISEDAQWGHGAVAVGDRTIVVLGSENSLWLGRFAP